MSTYQPINTTHKIINLDEKCGELCKKFKKTMNANRGLVASKKTISIYFTQIEREFLLSFLELNNISFSALLRYVYLMDGAMPVAYIKAIENEKMVPLDFIKFGEKGFDTSYFNKYKNYSDSDFEKASLQSSFP